MSSRFWWCADGMLPLVHFACSDYWAGSDIPQLPCSPLEEGFYRISKMLVFFFVTMDFKPSLHACVSLLHCKCTDRLTWLQNPFKSRVNGAMSLLLEKSVYFIIARVILWMNNEKKCTRLWKTELSIWMTSTLLRCWLHISQSTCKWVNIIAILVLNWHGHWLTIATRACELTNAVKHGLKCSPSVTWHLASLLSAIPATFIFGGFFPPKHSSVVKCVWKNASM